MSFYKTAITLFSTIFILQFGYGQKIHFSQFETLAPILNPALTGLIPDEDDLRISGIGRNQWSSFLETESFQTMGVSFDMRNCIGTTTNKNFNRANKKFESATWGLGLQFVRDASGVHSVRNIATEAYPLIQNFVSISSSIILPVNDRLLMNGGFRLGGQFHRLETDHLRYDEQFDNVSGFDSTIPGEFDDLDMLNSNMLDLSGGFSLMYLHEKKGGASIGAAINQVFRPVEYQFTDDLDQPSLARRITIHGKGSLAVFKRDHSIYSVKLKSVFLNQSPYQQWLLATDFIFQHDEGFSFALGGGMRRTRNVTRGYHTDALIGTIMINYKSLTVGFTTDINISNLEVASNNYGGAELAVIYHFKKKNSKCAPAQEGGCRIDKRYANPMYF